MAEIKINIGKLVGRFRKAPEVMAEKAFLVFFVLSFFGALSATVIFYKYGFLVYQKEETAAADEFKLRKDLLEKILNRLDENNKKFQSADQKTYVDIFRAAKRNDKE